MKKPVRMKKLRIVLHKDKKERVLRSLFEEGSFQLENVEVEGVQEKGAKSSVTVEAMSLLSRIESLRSIFNEMGIKGEGPAETEKTVVHERSTEKTLEEIKAQVDEMEGKVKSLYTRLHEISEERILLESHEKTFKVLEKLNIDFESVKEEYEKKFVHIYMAIGSMPTAEIRTLKQDVSKVAGDFALIDHPISNNHSLVFLVTMKKFGDEVKFILSLHSFKNLDIPEDLRDFELHDALIEIKERLANLDIEEKSKFRQLKEIAVSEKKNLNVFQELLEFERELDAIMTNFGRTVETYVIEGWVPLDKVYAVSDIIRKESEGLSTIEASEPVKGDVPPTLVNNPKFSAPLETITGAYGTPAYDEYDPTSLISITFPLIFGFMFGDVGQGLVIALVGYYIGFRLNVEEGMKKAGRTIMLAGISAFFVGFLYGAFFSIEGLFEPLWLSPVHAAGEHMNVLLGASLKFGVLILVIAMLANIANEVSHHKYAEAIVNKYGLAGIWMLLGGAIMISKHGTDLAGIVSDIALFVPLVIIPLLVIFFGAWKIEGEPLPVSLVDAVFEALVKFLVNTISFMRIIILAIIHGALSLIMVGVMDIMPPSTVGLIGKAAVFVLVNIIIIVMELFVSFIQTMRLHYYEIFSKFYKGTGKPFTPLRFIRKYTTLDKKI